MTDTALLTVGLVVFWPALLLMPATTDRKHEIAQMRGEKEALERATGRQCASGPVIAGRPNGVANDVTVVSSGTAAVTSAAAIASVPAPMTVSPVALSTGLPERGPPPTR